MKISAKIILIGVGGVLLTALVLVGTALWQGHVYNSQSQAEVNKLIDADLNHITAGAYALVKSQDESVQQDVNHALNVAHDQFQRTGDVSIGGAIIQWDAVNQFTKAKTNFRLPRMSVGAVWLGKNSNLKKETPLVDRIKALTGSTVTIFQRADAAGDLLRVATNVQTKDGRRAIGTFIPVINPDGKPNPVVASVMRGETYRGNAFVVNAWYVSAYEPIKDPQGRVVAVLYVGYKQENIPTLRQAILDIKVGQTGGISVLGSKGAIQGQYLISKDRRDGENVWNQHDSSGKFFVREILQKAQALQPGQIVSMRYRVQEADDTRPRWRTYRVAYYAPWDWALVTSAKEQDFRGFSDRLYAGQNRMMLLFAVMALLVAGGCGFGCLRWSRRLAMRLKQMVVAADGLACGDARQQIELHSHDEIGQVAESFRTLIAYQQEMAGVAEAIAGGDLTRNIVAKSENDVLGHTFNRMIANLRQLLETITGKSAALQDSEERYRSVVDNVREIIFTADITGRWTFLNPAWTAITGHDVSESLGQNLLDFVVEGDRPHILALCESLLRGESDYCRHEIRCRTKEQGVCWVEVRIQRICDAQENLSGFFGTLSDITERKEAEAQLQHLALHDALTGLPNRLLFQDRLRGALGRLQRQKAGIAVLFVDLDNFKYINDSMGHEAGDTLLKTISACLQDAAREIDTIARLGGDEFTLLLEGLNTIEEAEQVAERIVAALQQPMLLGERRIFASASIGIAYTDNPATPAEDILRDADIAMYRAKTNGKSGYVLFDQSMYASAVERVEIETGLRFALERGELRVHYQPLIDLETGQISGAEALVRWEHPTYGLMAPGKFIPIAEETGLILPIGYWVLEQACQQRQTWKAAYPDNTPFTINVNLSGKQLMREDVVERVRSIVEMTGIDPHELKLEITESVMMADVQDTVAKLREIKALGIQLAMDDFGTGYSSMASLNLFPLDTVKIDRAFISQLEQNEDARSVISAIIMLCKAMNLNVTGEGVETEEQVTFLQGLGCQIGQGYFFARPLTAEALDADMAARKNAKFTSQDDANNALINTLLAGIDPSGEDQAEQKRAA